MAEPDMGLAPGGRIKQEIYDDPYGLDAWDQRHYSRCFVTIANSVAWAKIYDCAGAAEALLLLSADWHRGMFMNAHSVWRAKFTNEVQL